MFLWTLRIRFCRMHSKIFRSRSEKNDNLKIFNFFAQNVALGVPFKFLTNLRHPLRVTFKGLASNVFFLWKDFERNFSPYKHLQ